MAVIGGHAAIGQSHTLTSPVANLRGGCAHPCKIRHGAGEISAVITHEPALLGQSRGSCLGWRANSRANRQRLVVVVERFADGSGAGRLVTGALEVLERLLPCVTA